MDIKTLKTKNKETHFVFHKEEDKTVVFSTDLYTWRQVLKTDSIAISEDFVINKKFTDKFFNCLRLTDKAEIGLVGTCLRCNDKEFEEVCGGITLDFGEFGEEVVVNADDMKKVGLSVCTDENRFFMTGIFFAENGDVVATDGRRLSLYRTDYRFPEAIVKPVVFDSFKGEVYISFSKECAKVRKGDTVAYTRLIDGNFPNYPKVIPESYSRDGEIDLTLFKNEKLYKGKFTQTVTFDGDIVSSELMEGEIGRLDNPFKKARFNGKYLNDIRKQYGDVVKVKIQEEEGEKILKAVSFGEENFFTVLMPNYW